MAASRPDTWMPIYWGDYARDTGHLNNAGHGAYLMLLKHYWCNGRPLNDDDDELWRIACCDSKRAWQKLRPKLEFFFTKSNGQLHHKRVDEELKRANTLVERKARAGRKGADVRWGADGTPNGSAITEPPPCHPESDGKQMARAGVSPSPSPSKQETPTDVGAKKELENLPEFFDRRTKGNGHARTRGTRIADDWQPDERDREFARSLGLDPERTAVQFADHWRAKAGKDGVALDWHAKWRTWCRNEAKWAAERLSNRPKPGGVVAAVRESMAERERGERSR